MKIIKLIKLILLKLIIRLDEALIEVKPNQDERNEANKAIFNANRQTDRATNVDALDKYKAVTGQAKAKLANKRANRAAKADTRRDEKEAKREVKRRDIRGNENKNDNNGRGEYNFRLWEITKSYKAVEWEVQPDHQPYPYSLFHSYLHSYSYYHYNLLHYFHIYLLSQALYENFLD